MKIEADMHLRGYNTGVVHWSDDRSMEFFNVYAYSNLRIGSPL